MSVKYAIKELMIRRHRTVVNCIGIAVAVALVISLYTITDAYKAAVRKPFEASGIDLVLEKPKAAGEKSAGTSGVILPDSATVIAGDEVQRLMDIEGIESIATSIQAWSFDRGNFKVIVGIDPNSPDIGPVTFVNWVQDGRFFESNETGVAVIEKHYAKSYGIKMDDEIEVAGEKFKIIGTVAVEEGSQLSAPNLFMPMDDIRHLTGIDAGEVNAIYIRLNQAVDTKTVMDEISGVIPGIKVSSPDSSLSVADSLFSLSERFIWLVSLVIMVVAVFLILKTVSASISERIREIGVMKAVGWTGENIRRQLTLETLVQAAIGGVLGIIAGVSLSLALSVLKINAPLPWQGSPIPGSSEAGAADLISLEISVSWVYLLVVLAVTIFIAAICGLIASRQAISIKPAEALRKI